MGPRCSNSWLVRTQNSRSLHKSIMKCLLVFAVALAAAHADHHEMKAAEMGHIQKVEEVKPVLTYAAHAQPLTYTYPVAHPHYTPVVYNHVAPKVQEVTQYVKQPDQVQYVAKPYHVAVQQPTVYKYNTKVLPGKVREVEVPAPQLKHVVEKVPVKPLCTNNFGAPVPCVRNE